jgi:hypothetical protein
MEPDPLDLPTSPSLPMRSVRSPGTPWPDQAGGLPSLPPGPPSRRLPWPLLAIVGAGLSVVLIVALLLTLLLTTRGGTTTVLLGAAADQTATAVSAQATSSAEGTPAISPTGTTGSTGPRSTATPRPAGATIHLVSQEFSSNSGGVGASCPSGEVALTGGWSADAGTLMQVSHRHQNGDVSSWVVYPNSVTAQVTVFVLCLQHVASAIITERLVAATIPAGASGTAFSPCYAGEVPIGGGFVALGDVDLVNSDLAPDHTGFRLTVANHSASPDTVQAVAECLSVAKAQLTVTTPAQQEIGAHGSGSVQISCPKGTLLSGGGVNLLNGSAQVTAFLPISAITWRAQVQNQTIVGTTVKLSAQCLSFS